MVTVCIIDDQVVVGRLLLLALLRLDDHGIVADLDSTSVEFILITLQESTVLVLHMPRKTTCHVEVAEDAIIVHVLLRDDRFVPTCTQITQHGHRLLRLPFGAPIRLILGG